MAIGVGAIADQADTVSFGNGGASAFTPATRRLVNVSAGVADSDAVNVGQMNLSNSLQDTRLTTIEALNLTQNSRLAALESGSTGLGGRVGALEVGQAALFDLAKAQRNESRRGIAAAVAMADAPFPSEPGKTSYAFNLATYRGKQAGSLSLMHRLPSDKPVALSFGVSHAGRKDFVARAGIAGEF